MKTRRYFIFLLGMVMAFCLASCGPNNDGGDFDPSTLVGHWQEGTVHEKYFDNGTGYTWDTDDDVSEEEAQPFEWTLEGDQLIQEHIMSSGTIVPRMLTITQLNEFQLVYRDTGGVTHTFIRALSIAL